MSECQKLIFLIYATLFLIQFIRLSVLKTFTEKKGKVFPINILYRHIFILIFHPLNKTI